MNRSPPSTDTMKHSRRIPSRGGTLRAIGLPAIIHNVVRQHGNVAVPLHFRVQHLVTINPDFSAYRWL